MIRYILVEWNMDINHKRVERTHLFENFGDFEMRVNSILYGSGPDSIIFAGTIQDEWTFRPVEVVKEYKWAKKI